MELSYPSHSRCSTIIDFSANVEMRAGVLSFNEHKIEKLEPPGHDSRCAVGKVISRIDQLVGKKQLHPSHQSYYCVFSHFLFFFNFELMLV